MKTELSKNDTSIPYKQLVIILCCVGVFLRVFQFFFNKSVWLDEAQLGNNILDMGFLELLRPMDNH